MSVDQFEETKYENTAMSKRAKVGRKLKLRLWDRRDEKRAVMIVRILSGWLASSYPIRRALLQHISERVSVESVINM